VTAGVAIAAIISTGALWAGWDGDEFLFDVRTWEGQVWRLVTATLLHLDVLHLGFNLYWLWVFGTAVERVFRPLATAGIFLLFAVGSSAAEYVADTPGVGLSGVGYGLFGLLLVLSRWDARFTGTMDRRTIILFLGWFLLCWAMTRTGAWRVANVAHGSGAVLGLLLGLVVVAHGWYRRVAVTVLSAGIVSVLVGGAMVTPSAEELVYVGYHDLENGRNDLAADKYQRALEQDPNQPDWWLNLGIARHRLGQLEGAAEAYRRGLALRPQDADLRESLLAAKTALAYQRHNAEDLKGAVALYREVLVEDEDNALTWYNLGLAYSSLGEAEPAREAFARAFKLDPELPMPGHQP
jgi:GlpG protein